MLYRIAKTSGLGMYLRRLNDDCIGFQGGWWIKEEHNGYKLYNETESYTYTLGANTPTTEEWDVFKNFIKTEIAPDMDFDLSTKPKIVKAKDPVAKKEKEPVKKEEERPEIIVPELE